MENRSEAARQQGYYQAIDQSTAISDSAPFMEFILEAIREGIEHLGNAIA